MAEERIRRLVFTGGPCGGKSLGLARLSEELPKYGVTPIVVPEIATLVAENGVKIKDFLQDEEKFYALEKEFLRGMFALEDVFARFAEIQPGGTKVLLCDRGAMDVEGYTGQKLFRRMVRELGYTLSDLCDGRYDAVHHMVTAADGAEAFYNFDNSARYETTGEARERDRKILESWTGHEHLRVIGNYEILPSGERKPIDFETKLKRLVREVCHSLGVPAPTEIERWFLVAPDTDMTSFPVHRAVANIRQNYLLAEKAGMMRRVREREYQQGVLHFYTEKEKIDSGVRLEGERIISSCTYLELMLNSRDPHKRQVVKERHSFVWRDQYFQLDFITAPITLVKLEVELTDRHEQLSLPPFLNIIREVTDDERYGNEAIAEGRCPGYEL